jgi:hypothetical protein
MTHDMTYHGNDTWHKKLVTREMHCPNAISPLNQRSDARVYPVAPIVIEIENLSYRNDPGQVVCLINRMARIVFPRSALAIQGSIVQVLMIHGTDYGYQHSIVHMTLGIPSSVRILRQCAICAPALHLSVTFERHSTIFSLEADSFFNCSPLSSIFIPSSVEALGKRCFSDCRGLSAVLFEPDSKLWRIEDSTFVRCSSLSSICIPSSVETIGK